jgi:small subunit ribosomal protein S15
MSLTKEKKEAIFSEFGGQVSNTGSTEGQIALITERMNQISEHLQTIKKTFPRTAG